MLPLRSSRAVRRTRPVALPDPADVARTNHVAERAAPGLPAHLEDLAVAARVVALLLPAGSMTTSPSSLDRRLERLGAEAGDGRP
jgi:hypothetical protein